MKEDIKCQLTSALERNDELEKDVKEIKLINKELSDNLLTINDKNFNLNSTNENFNSIISEKDEVNIFP